MVFFSLFVISAVILGAGAMAAPAWPSKAPRIGLSASFLLGLVAGGAVVWAQLFDWDTLIIDYLLFGIVSLVILGGTLSRGGNDEAGWPSRNDMLFFAFAALICMLPLFMSRSLSDNAAFDVSISQAVLDTGRFTGLAAPVFHALAAYLSQQLRQDIFTIHQALGSLLAFLAVWTVYDLGVEIQDKRLGIALAVLLLLLDLVLLWQSYYSLIMAILFALACMTYALRFYRERQWADMVAAGLLLGVIFLSL
jgi:hypothetical protein